jgi:aldose 1-epimerase
MTSADAKDSIKAVTLQSPAGMQVTLLNIGATIQSINVPTESGNVNAVLGYANHDEYLSDNFYMGATVGRFANRIGNARFSLGDKAFSVDANDKGNCLHGGSDGFHRRFWKIRSVRNEEAVEFSYISPDGESGFPGELDVSVTYQIIDDFSLAIDFVATTNTETIINIANHAYFNLSRDQHLIDAHHIKIEADYFTPVDDKLIPTGRIDEVEATRFDLRNMTGLHATGSKPHQSRQYDHNFVLRDADGRLREVAILSSPDSGLSMHLHTTQDGLQFYTGEFLTAPFQKRAGLCLEAQRFPDSPNQPSFPSPILKPGDIFKERTVYEFVRGKRLP